MLRVKTKIKDAHIIFIFCIGFSLIVGGVLISAVELVAESVGKSLHAHIISPLATTATNGVKDF